MICWGTSAGPGTCVGSGSRGCRARAGGQTPGQRWSCHTRTRTHASSRTACNLFHPAEHEESEHTCSSQHWGMVFSILWCPACQHLRIYNKDLYIIRSVPKNCFKTVFQPKLQFLGHPMVSSSPTDLLMMLAWPTISSNQSSMVALVPHHSSGPRWLMLCTAISWPGGMYVYMGFHKKRIFY